MQIEKQITEIDTNINALRNSQVTLSGTTETQKQLTISENELKLASAERDRQAVILRAKEAALPAPYINRSGSFQRSFLSPQIINAYTELNQSISRMQINTEQLRTQVNEEQVESTKRQQETNSEISKLEEMKSALSYALSIILAKESE